MCPGVNQQSMPMKFKLEKNILWQKFVFENYTYWFFFWLGEDFFLKKKKKIN